MVVAFGDKLAALALELAKEMTAWLTCSIDVQAAKHIMRNSLIDDIGGGGTPEQVSRMRQQLKQDGTYTGTLPKVLGMVGFKAKALVTSHTQL